MKWTSVERPGTQRCKELADIFAYHAGFEGMERTDHAGVSEGDLIVAIGGDGTAMSAMRLAATTGARIVAVHGGTLGFLADFSPEEIEAIPRWISEGSLTEDERFLLSFENPEGKKVLAANEFVIADVNSGVAHEFSFKAGGHTSGRFSADSLILSTPTGSTAYAMSSGGSIIHPHAGTVSISAVAPMTMSFRPVCVPSRKDIILNITGKRDATVSLKGDGIEHARLDIAKGQTLSFLITRATSAAVFMRKPEWDFFDTLSRKLGWATVPGLPT